MKNPMTLVAFAAILTTLNPVAFAAGACPTAAPKEAKTYCERLAKVEAVSRNGTVISKALAQELVAVRGQSQSANVRSWANKKALKALDARLAALEKAAKTSICANNTIEEVALACTQVDADAINHNSFFQLVSNVALGGVGTVRLTSRTTVTTPEGVKTVKEEFGAAEQPKPNSAPSVPQQFSGVHYTRSPNGAVGITLADTRPVPTINAPTMEEVQARREAELTSERGGFWVGCLAGAAILGSAGAGVGYGIGSKEELDGVVISNTEPKAIAISASVGAVVGCVGGGIADYFWIN